MAKNKKRSLDDLASGKQFETKPVHERTVTSNIGDIMIDKVKVSLDYLANGEKSETNGAHDSVNAGTNNEIKLKIDIDRGEVEKIITLSSFLAKASGARGTPSIFINNDFFGGYLAQEKIEDLLK